MFTNEMIETRLKELGKYAPRITPDHIKKKIKSEYYHRVPGTTLTICVLTLENGFTVIGESAAASPENFDEELGQQIALRNAENKIWALEGYLLREMLHQTSDA
jgi:hypothetical protein